MKNKYLNLFFFLGFDFLLALLSIVFSLLLADVQVVKHYIPIAVWSSFFVLVSYILKIYNILWRYAGLLQYLRIVVSALFSSGVLYITQMAIYGKRYSLSVYIFTFLFVVSFAITQRVIFKYVVHYKGNNDLEDNENLMSGNIMLIGAGSAGEIIIKEISNKPEYSKCKIKCVIDDNPYKQGQYISGVKVVGGRNLIEKAAVKYDISYIIFAIPNCKSSEKSEILNICQQTGCSVKVVPSICKMYNPTEISSAIREVQIEDLLGRDPVDINVNSILDYVSNKVVLVTGGGGTIGSELCRQIAVHKPKQLIIFDIYENNAYDIQNELRYNFPELNLVTLIGSVRDSKRLDYIFRTYSPNIVYHAAAHKHVPLMEDSPNETVKNNVFGTLKVTECADRYGVEKFLLISTDKAVNPTNIMGASKRICEMIIQTYNKHSKTEFVAVRFGNVLGSNGSVIPLFKKQIEHGGPVTVTDPNIIRYFMTIPEAVSLVLQAGGTAKGGEIFVLDMGEPVKILTLAENLIRLSGFKPYKDIKIEFTGLRPGEKLYEELLMSEEGLKATENELIHIGKPIDMDEELFLETLNEMKAVMYDENVDVRSLVRRIVPTYTPGN